MNWVWWVVGVEWLLGLIGFRLADDFYGARPWKGEDWGWALLWPIVVLVSLGIVAYETKGR